MPALGEIALLLFAAGMFALAASSGLRAFSREVVGRSAVHIWSSVLLVGVAIFIVVVTVVVTLALAHC